MTNQKLSQALFILRLGLAVFLLLWGIDKLMAPEGTVKIFRGFYFMNIGAGLAYLAGVFEILLSLAMLAGLWKSFTYGTATVIHGISTISSYQRLLDPFGPNHLFIASLPVLAAFIALFLLRDEDHLWTLK